MSTEADTQETLEGYVVDIACVRKYPHRELLDRAREHSKRCALMGHCMESGYGLIDEEGGLALLDAKATPKVAEALERSPRDHGVRLRATRAMQNEEMETVRVEEL